MKASTERHYWHYLWHIGLRATKPRHWYNALGFLICLVYCLMHIKPVVLEQQTRTIAIAPSANAHIEKLEEWIKEHATYAHIQRISGTALLKELQLQSPMISLNATTLPEIWLLSFHETWLNASANAALIKKLATNKNVDQMIQSKPSHPTPLLPITLSLLLMSTVLGSILWLQLIMQPLMHATEQFLMMMFPTSLLPSLQTAYHRRIQLFLLLSLAPFIIITTLLLSWLILCA